MQFKQHHILLGLTMACLVIAGCSTQKNTARSRWWQSFNTRYNVYYNGAQAYIDGSLQKEEGNQDNFTEMIPLYTIGNKKSIDLGKSNYERAIEKCEKAIHLHSIKRRPEWTTNKRKTPRDIEWLNRREFNPFLWKVWLLMGRSQFYSGQFDNAISTFAYMSRLYSTQPAIYDKARAWLAKCYIEQNNLYDAENVIHDIQRDTVHWKAVKEWDYTYADYYIHIGELAKAIPYLKKVIGHEMRRKQKAREWYLMGQILANLGKKQEAYKAFRHVTRLNPPYEIAFNARIAMTEVMAEGQAKKMIGNLRRMARSSNNEKYLDQVYYAIGNIYLAQKDTMQAIQAYEEGNEKATRNGIEKGVLLLHLGNLYWTKNKFGDAHRCYTEAIGLIDKERKEYKLIAGRDKVLEKLVPYTDAVELQDSLQRLSKMDEKNRNRIIDKIIDNLKKKEQKEQDTQTEKNGTGNMTPGAGNLNTRNMNGIPNTSSTPDIWYFYNPMIVNLGKTAFQRIWGKRENIDNWQRINKTVVAQDQDTELTDKQRDSVFSAQAIQDSIKNISDSDQNNPHKRAYYLKQIPFTPEQIAASNKILEDGLFHSGVIFKDDLDNLDLSERTLCRLVDNYPDYEHLDDAYYHLYLLYSRKEIPTKADIYLNKLKSNYPKSQWTTLLTDPYYIENARFGEHIEDSLYSKTYEAFKADRYNEVKINTTLSEKRFPSGENRDKFLFIGGMTKLNSGDPAGCIKDMQTLVEMYPKSGLAEMAGMIVNGVKQGKHLHGAKFDLNTVWNRRADVLNDSDAIKKETFSNERNINFNFILVYNPDSLNENQLLFDLAKFNFTDFLVRNFDITIDNIEGIHLMKVKGFQNYDEARQYTNQLYQQKQIANKILKAKAIIISDKNLNLIGSRFSYDDYDKFYNKHFAPLKISTFRLLTEPEEITLQKDTTTENPTPEKIDDMLDDGTFIDNNLEENSANQGTNIKEQTVKDNKQANNGINIPAENKEDNITSTSQNGTVIAAQPSSTTRANIKTTPASNKAVVIPKQKQSNSKLKNTTKTATVSNKNTKAVTPPKKSTSTGIYFDDDFGNTQNKNTTKKKESKPKKQTFDLEDEYYDLDGF